MWIFAENPHRSTGRFRFRCADSFSETEMAPCTLARFSMSWSNACFSIGVYGRPIPASPRKINSTKLVQSSFPCCTELKHAADETSKTESSASLHLFTFRLRQIGAFCRWRCCATFQIKWEGRTGNFPFFTAFWCLDAIDRISFHSALSLARSVNENYQAATHMVLAVAAFMDDMQAKQYRA